MTREELKMYIDKKAYIQQFNKDGRDFYDDLVELFKLDPTDPITSRMYGMAWNNGHAYGLYEVLSHFEDLVGVFKGE